MPAWLPWLAGGLERTPVERRVLLRVGLTPSAAPPRFRARRHALPPRAHFLTAVALAAVYADQSHFSSASSAASPARCPARILRRPQYASDLSNRGRSPLSRMIPGGHRGEPDRSPTCPGVKGTGPLLRFVLHSAVVGMTAAQTRGWLYAKSLRFVVHHGETKTRAVVAAPAAHPRDVQRHPRRARPGMPHGSTPRHRETTTILYAQTVASSPCTRAHGMRMSFESHPSGPPRTEVG